MSEKMLKVAGKTSAGVASPFLVGADGETVVSRPWESEINQIINALEIRDTNTYTSMANGIVIDMSKYPVNSLRIRSTLDADVRISFYADIASSGTTYLKKLSGSGEIVIPSDNNYLNIITPSDIDLINYIKFLKFKIVCDDAPTTGNLSIWHVGRY